jgi:tRNA 5-methylaminomethyl-2-thiouridine biosynthesis bifunctional protein
MPYYVPRAIFGHLIDIKTTTHNSVNMHQNVSISGSDHNGIIAIGATHNVHYNPLLSDAAEYDLNRGRLELIEKASSTLDLQNIEVLNDYMGVRSASIDHLPLVGPVVDAQTSQHYPNLYIINGVGGYGFVQAPYLAKMLSEHLCASVPIDAKVLPSRFYRRALAKKS